MVRASMWLSLLAAVADCCSSWAMFHKVLRRCSEGAQKVLKELPKPKTAACCVAVAVAVAVALALALALALVLAHALAVAAVVAALLFVAAAAVAVSFLHFDSPGRSQGSVQKAQLENL